jgi:hypothetical protein
MRVTVLETPVPIGRRPAIVGISYTPPVLTIWFDAEHSSSYLRITFDDCRGFRCLDEGDLARYWSDPVLAQHWMFQILDGGWLTDESANHLTVTLAMGPPSEFLICGLDDCVTVLSPRPPRFELEPRPAAV